MTGSVPVELLQRFLQASPEQQAAMAQILGWPGEAANGQTSEVRGPQSEEAVGKQVMDMVEKIHQELAAVRREFREMKMVKEAAITDAEARRLFALLKELDSAGPVRKAPASMVFRLYCQEGLSRAAVARACGCAESLVTLRLQRIQRQLGRKPSELRQVSGHLERVAEGLTDDRARQIHRPSALDVPEDEAFE